MHLSLKKECALGQFGKNCNYSCGHCSDVSQCSGVDGACQSGCAAGYQGLYCMQGKTVLNEISNK